MFVFSPEIQEAAAAATEGGFAELFANAASIWMRGGWAMWAIGANALILFGIGAHAFLRLSGKRYRAVSEKTWRLWIEHAKHREGKIGRLLDLVTAANTIEEQHGLFRGVRGAELAPVNRDLKVMRVCIAAAPLLGLLGTVTGMLETFGALATGSGGDKTMAAISKGISEALITTETGLVVALPGLFFQYLLSRMRDNYDAFLQRLENVCLQDLVRRQRGRRVA